MQMKAGTAIMPQYSKDHRADHTDQWSIDVPFSISWACEPLADTWSLSAFVCLLPSVS